MGSYIVCIFLLTIAYLVDIMCINTDSTLKTDWVQKGESMIIIDYKDRRPIYEQIIERFQELIVKGVLKPDSQLPSVRNLAMELSINPNTIQKAYAELERQGYLYSVKGRGSFVSFSDNLLELKQQQVKEELKLLVKKAKDLQIPKEKLTTYVGECYEREDET